MSVPSNQISPSFGVVGAVPLRNLMAAAVVVDAFTSRAAVGVVPIPIFPSYALRASFDAAADANSSVIKSIYAPVAVAQIDTPPAPLPFILK